MSNLFNPVQVTKTVLYDKIEEEIGHFFKKFECRRSDVLDVLTIMALPVNSDIRAEIKGYFEQRNLLVSTAGSVDHVLYHYKGLCYNMDLKYVANAEEFEVFDMLKIDPDFRVLFDEFISFCGFTIRDRYFGLKILSEKGEERFIPITSDEDVAFSLLGLAKIESKISDPDKFAEWILESERYGSSCFDEKNIKETSWRDRAALQILKSIGTDEIIAPTKIDLREKIDVEQALKYELSVLNEETANKLRSFFSEEHQLITTKKLEQWGYDLSKDCLEKIIDEVNQVFDEETPEKDVREYVDAKYKHLIESDGE